MSNTMKQKIDPKKFSNQIDNSDTLVERFWIQSSTSLTKIQKKIDPLKNVLSLIKKAKKVIILYSPLITSPDLQIELENAAKEGKRIYTVVKELKFYQKEKLLKYALLREYNEINSSYVIIDPKSNNAEGIWFSGNLSSQTQSFKFILNLNSSQIKETWGHFAHIFWNTQGQELFQGKIRNIPGVKPAIPVIPSILSASLRVEAITEFLESKPISELWFSPHFPQKIHYYHADVDQLILQISEHIKEEIFWDDLENSKVFGSPSLPFSMIKYSSHTDTSRYKNYLILMNDLGFILDEEQIDNLLTTFPEWDWKYVQSARINDINNSIILPNTNWDSIQPESIVNELPISLKDLYSANFDEWLRNEPKPERERQLRLAREIIYSWTLHPPYLPEHAKIHRLYSRWESFHNDFMTLLNSVESDLTLALNKESEFKKIKKKFLAKKGKWKDWLKEITELKKVNWEQEFDQTKFTRIIEKMSAITESLSSDVSELLEELQEKTKKKQSEKKDELDELEAIDPKISKKKREDKKRRDELKGLSHSKQKKDLKDKIPSFPLPEVGTLYEENTRWYLVIETKNEIDSAIKIASRYQGAKVVVMR